MTNPIPNVPRELLERAWRALANSATGREIGAYLDADPCAPECAETCARASVCATCSADLSSPSPDGVDGLEVVGTLRYFMDYPDSPHSAPGYITHQFNPASWDHAGEAAGEHKLCRLSDAQAIIDVLRGELKQNDRARRNQFETIGKLQDERDTLRQQIADARDEITQHSNDLALAYMKGGADMRQQRDRLAQILRDLVPGCKWRIMRPRIDAALAEIDNGN